MGSNCKTNACSLIVPMERKQSGVHVKCFVIKQNKEINEMRMSSQLVCYHYASIAFQSLNRVSQGSYCLEKLKCDGIPLLITMIHRV